MAEQIDISQKMTGHIQDHDRVSLDVTHGLRHLPMLALVSAIYLQIAAPVRGEVAQALASEIKLREKLTQLINELLPPE